jgi:hypothetical protein
MRLDAEGSANTFCSICTVGRLEEARQNRLAREAAEADILARKRADVQWSADFPGSGVLLLGGEDQAVRDVDAVALTVLSELNAHAISTIGSLHYAVPAPGGRLIAFQEDLDEVPAYHAQPGPFGASSVRYTWLERRSLLRIQRQKNQRLVSKGKLVWKIVVVVGEADYEGCGQHAWVFWRVDHRWFMQDSSWPVVALDLAKAIDDLLARASRA